MQENHQQQQKNATWYDLLDIQNIRWLILRKHWINPYECPYTATFHIYQSITKVKV